MIVAEVLARPVAAAPFYRVIGDGRTGWAAILQLRRHVPYDFPCERWTEASAPVRAAFLNEAPDHVDNLVGTATGGGVRLSAEAWVQYGVRAILAEVGEGHAPTQTAFDTVVEQLVAFVESPRVAVRFLAPLLNFQSDPGATIPFGNRFI